MARMLASALTLVWAAMLVASPPVDARVQIATGRAGQNSPQSQLESYLSEQDGTFGVAAVSLEDGCGVSYNAGHVFPAASMYKVLVMYRMFEQIDLLLNQQHNDRLPALLLEGTPVAHKTGELDDVGNDGGIVNGPGGRYIIVVMGTGADPDSAVEVEQQVSRMVYDQLGT